MSETFVLTEIRELLRRGDDVRVVARRGPDAGEPIHAGAREVLEAVTYVPHSRRRLIRAALQLLARAPRDSLATLLWCVRARPFERGTLRAFGEAAAVVERLPEVDHVHAHFAHDSATLALVLARVARRGFSFTAHAHDVFVATSLRLLRRKIGSAAFVAAPAEFTAAHVRTVAATRDRAKVVVVRNGVELARLQTGGERDSPPTILTVGRLVDKKGIDVVLHAAALLASRGVETRWQVIGDGPLRSALRELAASLGVDEIVELSGSRDHGYVLERLRAATAFVLPCRVTARGDSDAIPVGLVEALAAGVPVVTTAVAGIPEIVEDGKCGLLVPENDPDSVASAVQTLLADERLRARLGRGAQAAASGFAVETTVDRLRELFRAAASDP